MIFNTQKYIKVTIKNEILAIGIVDEKWDSFNILAYAEPKYLKKIGFELDIFNKLKKEYSFDFYESNIKQYSTEIKCIYNTKIVLSEKDTDIDRISESLTYIVFEDDNKQFCITEFESGDISSNENYSGRIEQGLSAENAFSILSIYQNEKIRGL